MATRTNDLHMKSLPDGSPLDERAVREDLAACYRLAHHFRWTDLVYNHISARIPGCAHHFLLNPFGLAYEEVTASNLVKVDASGNLVDGGSHVINKAAFVIHGAIHSIRPDVACVIHTHTIHGAAVSCLDDGFQPLTQGGMQFHERIAYHDYEGIAVDEAECARLAGDLGSHNAMILRNHGLITCGDSIGRAFSRMYYLEQACEVQLLAMSSGGRVRLAPADVRERTARQWERIDETTGTASELPEWSALRRWLDRNDPGYRE
ncbi:MAG: class II aldolase/adducin family protein [Bradyrhizobium sp.]|uniref:class II aldolase/adducin family protein n=1 Tax=Bradyrhizobium sp. TaxID=376 RepID=UPI003D0B510D